MAGRDGARARTGAAVVVAGVLLALAGCASGTSGSAGGGGAADRAPAAAAPQPGAGKDAAEADRAAGGTSGIGAVELDRRALVRTAELTVRVDDVAARAREAQDQARAAGGGVSGDTRSGTGDQVRADLVLQVRPDRLDGVLDRLGALGEEQQRSSSSEDVTEQVADVESRVATMRASIARVRAILARATRIGDVVSVEGELSRRITELESLQARQRALAGQVQLAVVTLHLVARQGPGAPPPAERGGFLGGLARGWDAFTAAGGWLLTALGAVLPFLLVLVPALLAARWYVRRTRRAPAPAPEPSPTG